MRGGYAAQQIANSATNLVILKPRLNLNCLEESSLYCSEMLSNKKNIAYTYAGAIRIRKPN